MTAPSRAYLEVQDFLALTHLPGHWETISNGSAWSLVSAFPRCTRVHSEFHPTSLHIGRDGRRLLDFARTFNGPGLLDLASWPPQPGR